jgi:lysine-specific demethylase/histidyl-hydroxylase NO66
MLGIDWLLSPYDKNVFFEEIWQKRPEVLATGRAGYFEGVFSKEEVERIIEFAQPRPPLIKLSSASSDDWTEVPFSPNGRIDIDQLRKLYLQGETVILRKVEDFSPAIARLARAIETEMGARVQVNSYLTPPSAQAFPAHYDTHDVLVAQIQGEKLWKVYGSDSVCPLNEMHAGDESYLGHKQPQFRPHQHQLVPDGDARNEMDDGDPQFRESVEAPEEIRLKAGDLLYIPRGWIHEAVTDQVASLHLTIGVYPPLGKDLLNAALEAMVDRHRELREALPVGPLGSAANRARLEMRFAELVELFATHASAAEAAQAIDDQLLHRGRSGGDGHLFQDIENLGDLASDSQLERRTDLPCRLVNLDGGVGLQFLNGIIRGPEAFKAAMSFVATQTEPFAVSDLPGLPTDHQLLFASSLVTDGLCRLCERG